MESDLRRGGCQPCEGGMAGLSAEAVQAGLQDLPGWRLDGHTLRRDCHFKNFYETMAFVNAIAWIAHREDHHPDLLVSYNRCNVSYNTHTVKGLSENDFMPAVNGNVGYNHEYFEVSGGVGFPNLLNASIRLGPENCNLNAQAFSSVPLISGEGFGSAGVSITQYFEAGLSFGIPQGYYFSGILPINESNKIRLTYKISREYKEEFGFSISLIHFNF